MKRHATVWTLSWDTDHGTNCRVFGSEDEWFTFFRDIIQSAIRNIDTPEATAIRSSLAVRDIGLAYELWQSSYKPELDTYNWDSQEIDIEAPPQPARATL
jgi:hypothetical protein